jgi:hypothetical protein
MTLKICIILEKIKDEEANQISKEYKNNKKGGYERKKDENSYCSVSVKLTNLTRITAGDLDD